jgi:5-methyltetrahydrofolate--homocysteine methyltransferase
LQVLDASRSVPVVSALLDQRQSADFAQEVAQEYRELRTSYLDSVKDQVFLSLAQARERRLQVDWTVRFRLLSLICLTNSDIPFQKVHPVKPTFFGAKTIEDYSLEKLREKIDWNPFFATWQLRGTHPNRNYPKIFLDAKVGPEAKRLFDEAQAMIDKIVSDACVSLLFFDSCDVNISITQKLSSFDERFMS